MEERSKQTHSEADRNLEQALATFCTAGLGPLAEFFVDARSVKVDQGLRGPDGWLAQAFVSFMALHTAHDKIGAEMDLLIQSVHHFSEKSIVVANFGDFVPTSWTQERFPRLVLVHARDVKALTQHSFNFNKLTAMLFTKVRTGIALDADQWANHGLDYLFERAEAETTKDYPYPIMPVHWMSRDPESDDMKGFPDSYTFRFVSSDAPRLRKQGWVEDEDLLNMALWADNATKQWCKYDTPSPKDFNTYLVQQVKEGAMLGPDSKWFPHGIAYIFFTAHDAKNPKESFGLLKKLWNDEDDQRRAMYYRGHWFGSGKALRSFDAGLGCLA